MNAVEFNATVQNGHIALPENQHAWNGKSIRVILLDASTAPSDAKAVQSDDFFDVAGIWAQRDDITQASLRRTAWRAEPK